MFQRFFIFIVFVVSFSLVAHAADVSLFPAASYQHDSDTSRTEINLGYPVFNLTSREGTDQARIPFAFSYRKEADTKRILWDFVWPLFTIRSKPREEGGDERRTQYTFLFMFDKSSKDTQSDSYKKFTFFPFLYTGTDKNDHSHFIFFPFIWYANDAYVFLPFPSQKPQSYLAFWPFFGDFRNLGGNDRIQTILWPLFTKVNNPGKQQYHFLWPVFGYGNGEGYKALSAWPLFSYAQKEDEYTRMNYIWPLGYHRKTVLKDGGVKTFDLLFPLFVRQRTPKEKWDYYLLFGRKETPKRSQWGILGPVFRKAHFTGTEGYGIDILFSLFKLENSEEARTRQVFPLFGHRRKPKELFYYFLWPVFRHKTTDFETYTYKRTYFFPFYIGRNMEYHDGSWEKRRTFFPFFGTVSKSDGSWKTSALRLFYYDKADAMERNWSSLMPVYNSEGDSEGHYSRRVFGKIYHREYDTNVDQSEVNTLVLQLKREGETREYNFLGGLFGVKKTPEKTSFKVFFIPL